MTEAISSFRHPRFHGDTVKALSPTYIQEMRAHTDEGGQLSHRNGMDLLAEVERLQKMVQPQWFYPEGDTSSDACCESVNDVIDYYDLSPGKHYVIVECATQLPDVHCVVHVFNDEEKAARDDDENWQYVEYPSAADAKTALEAQP
ncbi:MAG: hypothetical protein DCC73_14850 [Proteobacteria bacterium]|nr:MAG: hypothetical protein DCC73_14850 [Pseudomonadota bacterium]